MAPARRGREQALAAEVVVALDDDVGPHARPRARRMAPRAQQRRCGPAQRRRARRATDASRRSKRRRPACDGDVHLVAARREARGDRQRRASTRPSCRERSDRWRSRGSASRRARRPPVTTAYRACPIPCRAARRTGPTRMRPNSSRSSSIRRQRLERPRSGPPRASRAFAASARRATAAVVRVRRSARRRAHGAAARRASCALGHAHQDVLDEAADERRVVADAGDAEAGARHDALEVRDVGERVEVVRLAQALLRHVDEAQPLEPPRQRVDRAQPAARSARSCARGSRRRGRRPARGPAPLRAACRRAPPATGARARRARSAFVNAPSAERQLPQIGEREVGVIARLARRRTDSRRRRRTRAPLAAFQSIDRPLPHPRSTTRSPGPSAQEAGEAVAAARPTPSSGGDTARAAHRHAAPRRGTWSARRTPSAGRRSRKSRVAPADTRPQDRQMRGVRVAGRASAPRQSGQHTTASRSRRTRMDESGGVEAGRACRRSPIASARAARRRRPARGPPRGARPAPPTCTRAAASKARRASRIASARSA